MAPDPIPTWPLSAFQFPERWWDVHLVRTPLGDVLPIRTRYPDGTMATGPIVTGEFVLAEDLEARRQCVREIIVANLQPRSWPDPDHGPPPAIDIPPALSIDPAPLELEAPEVEVPETPEVEVPETPTTTPVEKPEVTVPETKGPPGRVQELLDNLEDSVAKAKEAKKPK